MEQAGKVVYSKEQLREVQQSRAVQTAVFTVPERCKTISAAPVVAVSVVRHAKPVSASLAVLRQIIPDLEEDEIAPERLQQQRGNSMSNASHGPQEGGKPQAPQAGGIYVAPVVSQVERDTLAQIQKHFVQRMKSATTAQPAATSSNSASPGSGLAGLRSDKSAVQAASLLNRLQTMHDTAPAASSSHDATTPPAAGGGNTAERSLSNVVHATPAPTAAVTTVTAGPLASAAPNSPPSSTATSANAAEANTAATATVAGSLSASAKPHVPDFIMRQLKAEPFVPKSKPDGAASWNVPVFAPTAATAAPFNFQSIYSQLDPAAAVAPRQRGGAPFVPDPHAGATASLLGERGRSGVVHYNPPMLTKDELCGEWEKWWSSCGWRFYSQFFPIPIPVAVDKTGKPLIFSRLQNDDVRASAHFVEPSSRPLPIQLLGGMGITVKVVPASTGTLIPGSELKKVRRRTRGGKRRRGKRGGRGTAARAAARAAGLPMPNGTFSDDDDDDEEDEDDEDGDEESGSDSDDIDAEQLLEQIAGAVKNTKQLEDEEEEKRKGAAIFAAVKAGMDKSKAEEDEEREQGGAEDNAHYRELRFRTPDRNDDQQRDLRHQLIFQATDSPATIASSGDVALTADQAAAQSSRGRGRTRKLPAVLSAEAAARRMWQRERQVALGTRTLGFKVWERMKATNMPAHVDCTIPRASQPCSKRSWDGQMRRWRQQIHEYDNLATSIFTPDELLALPTSQPLEPIPEQFIEDDYDHDDEDEDEDDFIVGHDSAPYTGMLLQEQQAAPQPPLATSIPLLSSSRHA